MMYRILIVEDDPSIAAGLSYALEKEGYFVTQCRSVAEAFSNEGADGPDQKDTEYKNRGTAGYKARGCCD